MSGIRLLAFFLVVSVVGMATPGLADAADSGAYVGGDIGTTFVYTDGTYAFDYVRLKAGYRINPHIAVEAQVRSGGNDQDYDPPEGYRKWEAGTAYGLFIKPIHAFHRGRVEIYGLVGVSWMKTSYRLLDSGILDSDNTLNAVVGVGGQYNFTPQFGASLDWMVTGGNARYAHVTGTGGLSVEIVTIGASFGLDYRF